MQTLALQTERKNCWTFNGILEVDRRRERRQTEEVVCVWMEEHHFIEEDDRGVYIYKHLDWAKSIVGIFRYEKWVGCVSGFMRTS